MYRKGVTSAQEQAFFVTANAMHEGTLGRLLCMTDTSRPADVELPQYKDEAVPPPPMPISETQLAHIGFLAAGHNTQTGAIAKYVTPSGMSQANTRLKRRYGATTTEQAMRLAIEHRDLEITIARHAGPSILGDNWERQLTLLGLISHGLSVADTSYALNISPRLVGRHLQTVRENLGATTTSAVFNAFETGILEREGTVPMHREVATHKPVVVPLRKQGIIPRIRALFTA